VHAVKRGDVVPPAVPAINRIIYDGLPDPKARAPPRTISTPSPVYDGSTTSLMQQLHGLQLNLARARQSTRRRVRNLIEDIVEKCDCINKKDECIDVLTDCKERTTLFKYLTIKYEPLKLKSHFCSYATYFCPRRQRTKRKVTNSKQIHHCTRC
jgi:hypothetical protein